VSREVVRAEVGLDLDDAADALDTPRAPYEVLPEQVLRDGDRVAVVERARQLA